jgi:putative transposase
LIWRTSAFFRRLREGSKPGFPRFRSRHRYDSLTFKQYGNSFGFDASGKLILSKLGHVKIVLHRKLLGTPKTAIVTRSPTGKWYVSIACEEVAPTPAPPSNTPVGLDVGLKTFAYLSTDEKIENPRFFRNAEQTLSRAQRKLSKCPKGSPKRKIARKVVARVHERIKNQRDNFMHQESRKVVNRFGLIAVEQLSVRNLVKNPALSKSIADASWSMFFTALVSKAEEAGRQVIRVNPAYTSQTCSACGHRQKMPLSVRVYECEKCDLILDRDHNASKNILEAGLHACGRASGVVPEAPGYKPGESSLPFSLTTRNL